MGYPFRWGGQFAGARPLSVIAVRDVGAATANDYETVDGIDNADGFMSAFVTDVNAEAAVAALQLSLAPLVLPATEIYASAVDVAVAAGTEVYACPYIDVRAWPFLAWSVHNTGANALASFYLYNSRDGATCVGYLLQAYALAAGSAVWNGRSQTAAMVDWATVAHTTAPYWRVSVVGGANPTTVRCYVWGRR